MRGCFSPVGLATRRRRGCHGSLRAISGLGAACGPSSSAGQRAGSADQRRVLCAGFGEEQYRLLSYLTRAWAGMRETDPDMPTGCNHICPPGSSGSPSQESMVRTSSRNVAPRCIEAPDPTAGVFVGAPSTHRARAPGAASPQGQRRRPCPRARPRSCLRPRASEYQNGGKGAGRARRSRRPSAGQTSRRISESPCSRLHSSLHSYVAKTQESRPARTASHRPRR